MKKLCALLLSMIMALSLTAPAFADGPDGPPAEADLGIIGGADGPTAVIIGHSLEDFKWDGYDLERLYPDSIDWEELDKLMQQYEQQLIDNTKEALGGVPGQVGVMIDGKYIQFPDAAPEIVNGRTMVPVRALVEALGGEVDYQAGEQGAAVRLIIGGYAYEFAIGSTTAAVRPAGDGGEKQPDIEMDCAPYIKGGRTYVPVRFISEALGYEVGWDSQFQTAILLDRAALAEEYDQYFTIMNKVQADRIAGWEEGKSLQTDVEGSVTVTAFDTLNGDKTYQADFSSQMLMNEEAASGSSSIELPDEILDLWIGQYGYLDEEVLERMRLMAESLEDTDFIMTREGLMWVHSPVLDELGGAKDIWCGMEMDEMETRTVFASTDAVTIGAALAAMASTGSVMTWSQVDGMAAAMAELYRDEKFTTSGGVSTLVIGADDLDAMYAGFGIGSIKDQFKEFTLTMTVDGTGGTTVSCTMETIAQYGTPAVKLALTATQSGGRADMTMDVHAANIGEMTLTLSTTQKAVGGMPMTQPPAGANVVDAPALLGS